MENIENIKVEEPPCVLEPAVLPPKSGNMTSLPGRIVERKDLMILVTGSMGCVRGIYRIMRKREKLHQMDYVLCDFEDYKSGKWLDKYVAKLNELLTRRDIGGIIIYASCLDCLARVNINKIKPLLVNPYNIPVELLLRGPVSSSTLGIKPKEKLEELLATISETDKTIDENVIPLAPPLPDFVGAGNAIQSWKDTYNFVFEIGGCSACISLDVDDIADYNLRKTTFDGYTKLLQYKETLGDALKKDIQDTKKQTACMYMTNGAVVQNAKIAMADVVDHLQAEGLAVEYLPATAYGTSVQGHANALLTFAQNVQQTAIPVEKTIGVLGSEKGSPVPVEKIDHAFEHMEWDNYKAQLWDGLGNAYADKLGHVTLNWVTSLAGLSAAQYMQKKFGTPYFVGVPMGMDGMKAWRNKLYIMMDEPEKLLELPAPKSTDDVRSFLLIGDPVLTAGIKEHLLFLGYSQVKRAVQTPFDDTKAWVHEVLSQVKEEHVTGQVMLEEPQYFAEGNALKALAEECNVIIGDAVYTEFVRSVYPNKQFIVIEDREFSQGLAGIERVDYKFFGKKGAAWLEEKLGLC